MERDPRPRRCRLADVVPDGARLVGDGGTVVSDVAYDSRLVRPGSLFAALVGGDVDGHAFVPDAIARGAAALLVEREVAAPVPQLVVPSSRAALADVAAEFFGQPSAELDVVGVTGTDGKTTTAFLVDHLLRAGGLRTGMVGTVAVRVGETLLAHETRQTTPESADIQRYLRQMVDAGSDWGILEATSHGLAMHRLDRVRFAIGAVTNVTHEHLDFHGTVEAYRRAKGILFERTGAAGGALVVNADDEGARSLLAFGGGGSILRYAVHDAAADLRAVDVVSDGAGSRFRLEGPGGRAAPVRLPLIGEFNVANALCAAAIALAAGVELPAIAEALGRAPAVPGRMAAIAAGQPFAVVVDYAHTPDALAKVLRLLRRLQPGGRLAVVFGSAGERDVEKRPRQGAVAAQLADFAVFTSEDPRHEDAAAIIAAIAAGAAAAGGREGETYVRVVDRRAAFERALGWAGTGDCVLLAGKGHEGSIIWGREKRPWDEAAVAREVLAELGYGADGG